jgi:hypothetical protein
MSDIEVSRVAETAMAAAAEQARALVETRYAVALKRPRDLMIVRSKLMDESKRRGFAEMAEYRKPLGKKKNDETGQWEQQFAVGPSIRFAEAALRAMGNVHIASPVIYEDDAKRIIRVVVTDLESNIAFEEDFSIDKSVERADAKFRQVISKRVNSEGRATYLVRATEDELANKVNAGKSKAIRNSGLRIVPGDITEDAVRQARQTLLEEHRKDPKASVKRLIDTFGEVRVSAAQIREWLGHDIDQMSTQEYDELRGIGAAIRDGQAKWTDYMEAKRTSTEAATASAPAQTNDARARTVARARSAAAEKPEQSEQLVEQLKASVNGAAKPTREPGED